MHQVKFTAYIAPMTNGGKDYVGKVSRWLFLICNGLIHGKIIYNYNTMRQCHLPRGKINFEIHHATLNFNFLYTIARVWLFQRPQHAVVVVQDPARLGWGQEKNDRECQCQKIDEEQPSRQQAAPLRIR